MRQHPAPQLWVRTNCPKVPSALELSIVSRFELNKARWRYRAKGRKRLDARGSSSFVEDTRQERRDKLKMTMMMIMMIMMMMMIMIMMMMIMTMTMKASF